MSVELLAPAGDLNRLKVAVMYGADAVYFGGKQFSLRARASNFDISDIQEAVLFAHSHNCKVYVTVNIIPHNSDFVGLKEYLHILEELEVDAIICASQAIADMCKKETPKLEVHISTQQTTINSLAIKYWQDKGADRIVLGREVTLSQLKKIKANSTLPIEVFIHGGMCANYSGRCTISNVLTNRDANRGGCAQSCRWNYHLYNGDDKLDKEDYLMSLGSKDMCAVDYLEDILNSGVVSLKIEGRMKTAFYIASVIRGYRYLIDTYEKNGFISDEELNVGKMLINIASNREAFPGFYPGIPGKEGQIFNVVTTANQSFVGNVVNYDSETNEATIEVRNNFKVNDTLNILDPRHIGISFEVEKMLNEDDEEVEVANKPLQKLKIKVPVAVDKYSFLYVNGGHV